MSETTRFGRYLLEERLAVGGTAEVYLGRIDGPEGGSEQVVVKRMLPHLQDDANQVAMFIDEARLASRFEHPNLVEVYELEQIDGQYCLGMEYVDGADVAALLEQAQRLNATVPLPIVAQIIAGAAEGLHYAHELRTEDGNALNVVHRDVSPANIIVTWSGAVKVVDFGIAKHTVATSRSVAGTLKGKFAYMSPEQARGERLDRRSDVFSLGTVFYELLTVAPCFCGASQYEVLEAVSHARFQPARKLRPRLPTTLDAILGRTLALAPDARYPTAQELSADLRRYLTQVGVPSANEVGGFLRQLFTCVDGEARASYTRTSTRNLSDEAEWPMSAPAVDDLPDPEEALPTVVDPTPMIQTTAPVLRPRRAPPRLWLRTLGIIVGALLGALLAVAVVYRTAVGSGSEAPEQAENAGGGPEPSHLSPR